MTQLYRLESPRRSFHMAVSHGHQIHVEEFGLETGLPVIICHGGPGSGLCRHSASYFNPQRYRIILFSQRGCGQSSPQQLTHNTTEYLLQDIDSLLSYLDISQCVLAGGSWGATLALLFAQRYPQRVLGLVLWATFLGCQSDLQWLYGISGAGAQFYPERYQVFSQGQGDYKAILSRYTQLLHCDDEVAVRRAAQQWHDWDRQLSVGSQAQRYQLDHEQAVVQQARIMVHYFNTRCFIEEQQIFQQANKIASLPVWMIHSRHDYVCRFAMAQALAEQLNARLLILEEVGHCATNAVYSEAIRRAADLLLCKLAH
ncbi:alpha/beta fold hydrolase [Pseudoalteromonas sp. R3]|uniref:alpha/beta fold hydrolase n=1 Tax=Pseudoalteromonas sp. R3 TaxID=1709477 RepID=UPI0006B63F7E|nr:alpha/beta fold hydrolase [Pseudoalteromonas sp. R3]AZZ99726.1 alpha/beta fold hydrolase [Pseudoalteromonas sp. R3]